MKKSIYAAIVIAVMWGGYMVVNAMFTQSYEIPTTSVSRGEFLVSLNVNGEVDAEQAYTLSAPRVRGLQITWLAPEGITVAEGDDVIKFDASQQIADLANLESELKIKNATLERARKEYTIQEKRTKTQPGEGAPQLRRAKARSSTAWQKKLVWSWNWPN